MERRRGVEADALRAELASLRRDLLAMQGDLERLKLQQLQESSRVVEQKQQQQQQQQQQLQQLQLQHQPLEQPLCGAALAELLCPTLGDLKAELRQEIGNLAAACRRPAATTGAEDCPDWEEEPNSWASSSSRPRELRVCSAGDGGGGGGGPAALESSAAVAGLDRQVQHLSRSSAEAKASADEALGALRALLRLCRLFAERLGWAGERAGSGCSGEGAAHRSLLTEEPGFELKKKPKRWRPVQRRPGAGSGRPRAALRRLARLRAASDELAGAPKVCRWLKRASDGKRLGAEPAQLLSRAYSMDSRSVNAGCDGNSADGESEIDPRDVWVHVYHCDPYTGFLNRMLLKDSEIGIYHAAIEIYGEEWSFQYFEDTWNDPSVSGLIRCVPKAMDGYEYQESINLGPSPLREEEVDRIIGHLAREWPASSYHLTHQNCLTFAQHFASQLKAPRPFPAWILGILEASRQRESIDAVVDYSWSWAKWWMIRKHQPPDTPKDDAQSSWLSVFSPTQSCSGAFCPSQVASHTRAAQPHPAPSVVF
ncbi:unnamed protein product [Polarella glacialis]|uniref:PPPDE domain-containing protein n=1 Tax=Polarella glacialis TaxID=89957 RepID=A0A813FUE2_POLGL|nr:unnamed protein product [Polarella glacialis]